MPSWIFTRAAFDERMEWLERLAKRLLRDHEVMALDHEEMMARNQLLERRVSFLENQLRQTRESHRKSDDFSPQRE
jgi:hypothetical protein